MKILFFGTPEYVVPILEALHKEYNHGRERQLIGVVTKPPEKVGREQKVTFSAVDTFAHTHKIPIFFDFDELPEFDLGICAAFGKIIPDEVLSIPTLGIINVHPSLLPLWRGTAPTQAAIMSGEQTTGVSILKTDSQMDHGPIISSFKSQIEDNDTNETLRKRLFEESVPFLLQLIPSYIKGKIHLKVQDDTKATFTRMLKKDHGYIKGEYLEAAIDGKTTQENWQVPYMKDYSVNPSPETIERFIRSISPWPGAYTNVKINDETKRLKILEAHVTDQKLVLNIVHLEGKTPVSFEQFKEGYPNFSFQ